MALPINDKPTFRWRVKERCDNCPFMTHGAGAHLRETLGPARWNEITQGLLNGQKFDCHHTTDETGNGTNLYCAGALDFQKARGIDTKYIQLCRSFEHVRETKEEIFMRLQGSVTQSRFTVGEKVQHKKIGKIGRVRECINRTGSGGMHYKVEWEDGSITKPAQSLLVRRDV